VFRTSRLSRTHSDDPGWLRPINPRRFTVVRFAPSVKRPAEVANPDAAMSRITCMAEHPSAQSRRQAVA
jgi:hypothetical protein